MRKFPKGESMKTHSTSTGKPGGRQGFRSETSHLSKSVRSIIEEHDAADVASKAAKEKSIQSPTKKSAGLHEPRENPPLAQCPLVPPLPEGFTTEDNERLSIAFQQDMRWY